LPYNSQTCLPTKAKLPLVPRLIGDQITIEAGPSTGLSNKGGQKPEGGAKNQKGSHIFKILYWMFAAAKGPNVKWGAHISNGGPGTTGTTAGDGPASKHGDSKFPILLLNQL